MVTVEVDDVAKGSPGRTGQFMVPGGTLGRYRPLIVGAPQFAVGDEVSFPQAAAAAKPDLRTQSGRFRVSRWNRSRRAS